jgi:hypothetical protein
VREGSCDNYGADEVFHGRGFNSFPGGKGQREVAGNTE